MSGAGPGVVVRYRHRVRPPPPIDIWAKAGVPARSRTRPRAVAGIYLMVNNSTVLGGDPYRPGQNGASRCPRPSERAAGWRATGWAYQESLRFFWFGAQLDELLLQAFHLGAQVHDFFLVFLGGVRAGGFLALTVEGGEQGHGPAHHFHVLAAHVLDAGRQEGAEGFLHGGAQVFLLRVKLDIACSR